MYRSGRAPHPFIIWSLNAKFMFGIKALAIYIYIYEFSCFFIRPCGILCPEDLEFYRFCLFTFGFCHHSHGDRIHIHIGYTGSWKKEILRWLWSNSKNYHDLIYLLHFFFFFFSVANMAWFNLNLNQWLDEFMKENYELIYLILTF